MIPSTQATAPAPSLADASCEDFAAALVAARKAARLLQKDLAAELGLSTRTLMRWEGGKAMPRVDVRDAIVSWLRSRSGSEAEFALAALGALFVRSPPGHVPAPPSPEAAREARLALEQALYRAAEAHDVPARAARQIALAVLAAAEAAGVGTAAARALLTVDPPKM